MHVDAPAISTQIAPGKSEMCKVGHLIKYYMIEAIR